MSSEAITKNDLSSILDGIGMKAFNTGDLRKLLWTNPSPTSSFAAGTVEDDLTDYDCVEIWFKEDGTLDSQLGSPIRISVGKENSVVVVHDLARAGVNENTGSRHISVSTTGVSFGNYQYKNRRSGGSLTTDNSFCVPYKIYGIKLGTGYRQNELLITDAELETLGAALGVVDKLYNILNEIISSFGKELTLSNSNWTSGNCTVSGSSKYLIFLIYLGDQMLLAYRSDNHIYGCGESTASGGTIYSRTIDISTNGDVWTYNYSSVLGHWPSSNHSSAITNAKIAKVIGLVPNWSGA